jgi:beta-1,4-mannooligosaccharide/beta-1,4-mannosyl-N-acetylglucosamine phosphorylase
MFLIRSANNPIITRKDIPSVLPHLVDVSSVFNPGAVKIDDKYLLIIRVQNRGRETFLLKAESSDGEHFNISQNPIHFDGIESVKEKIFHIYDVRITKLENIYYLVYAMDMEFGCRLGLASTRDFSDFKFLGIISKDDSRNGVLFPERIDGKYLMYERPNLFSLENGPKTGSEIYLSESIDLVNWRKCGPVLEGRFHYWDEFIGSGPPPIKTKSGWLNIYHGVATHFASSNIYQAGVFLSDLNNPQKIIARSKYNILEPRELYELTGQVANVVFPTGAIVEEYDSSGFAKPESGIKIYYGAADTCVCLCTSTIGELVSAAYK